MRGFIHYIGTVESPTPVGSVHTMSMTSALPSVAGIPLVAMVALKALLDNDNTSHNTFNIHK